MGKEKGKEIARTIEEAEKDLREYEDAYLDELKGLMRLIEKRGIENRKEKTYLKILKKLGKNIKRIYKESKKIGEEKISKLKDNMSSKSKIVEIPNVRRKELKKFLKLKKRYSELNKQRNLYEKKLRLRSERKTGKKIKKLNKLKKEIEKAEAIITRIAKNKQKFEA